jgi:hypothetical protein
MDRYLLMSKLYITMNPQYIFPFSKSALVCEHFALNHKQLLVKANYLSTHSVRYVSKNLWQKLVSACRIVDSI